MSGGWIKMRKSLSSHPVVERISDGLDIPIPHVVGCLFTLWCWADGATTTGFVPGLGARAVDRRVGVDGFGEALVRERWLVVDDTGLTIPEFDKWLGPIHRKRARDAKNSRAYRARQRSEPSDVGPQSSAPSALTSERRQTDASEQRQRNVRQDSDSDLVNSQSPSAPSRDARGARSTWRTDLTAQEFARLAQHPGFEAAWDSWLAYRRETKLKAPAQRTYKATWRKALEHGPAALVAAIEQSIAQGWQGLFPEKHVNGSGVLSGLSRQPTGQEVVASLRRKMAAQAAAGDEGPRDVVFEPLFKVLPMPVKKEA